MGVPGDLIERKDMAEPAVMALLGLGGVGVLTAAAGKVASICYPLPPRGAPPQRPQGGYAPPAPNKPRAPQSQHDGRDLVAWQRQWVAERAAREPHPQISAQQIPPISEIPIMLDANEALAKWITEEIVVTGNDRDEIHETQLIMHYMGYCDGHGYNKLHPDDMYKGLMNFAEMRGYGLAQDEKGIWLTHGRFK
jgi:hypothetical protein